jgi:hypothetical protein
MVLDWLTVKANNAASAILLDARASQSRLVRFPSMKSGKLKTIVLVLSFVLVALPFVVAHGAGGRIEGRVTDPKGAVVSGATVTVTDPVSNQTFSASTDDQGRYKY